MSAMRPPSPEQQRKANVRLALILAGVALAFAVGFVARAILFAR